MVGKPTKGRKTLDDLYENKGCEALKRAKKTWNTRGSSTKKRKCHHHHHHILFAKKGGGLPEKPKLIIRWSPII